MTEYLLASGTNKAPATRAPEHMAAWPQSGGYQLAAPRPPAPPIRAIPSGSPGSAAAVDRRCVSYDACARNAIVRQVLTAAAADSAVGFGAPQVT